MPNASREDVLQRLRCIEGHTRGVSRMVDSGADCLSVVRQVNAVKGALDKVAQLILQEHLMNCIPDSFSEKDPNLQDDLLIEFSDLLAISRSG